MIGSNNAMRKLVLSLAFVAIALNFASCSNDSDESVVSDVKVSKTFGISSGSEETRTYVNFDRDDEDGSFSTMWSKGDLVSIFAEGRSKSDRFKFDNYGTKKYVGTFNGKTYEADNYYVLYPYQENASLSNDGLVTFNIPAVQKATNGTFDPKSALMLGKATSAQTGSIVINHVCAFFVLTVGPGCTSVSITGGNAGWHLAGTVSANVKSAGNPIVAFNEDCTNVISLDGIDQVNGGTYMLSFIPSNSLSSFTVHVGFSNGKSHTPHFAAGKQFEASGIYELGTFTMPE